MASARKGGKNRPQPKVDESVKRGLDVLLKSFRDDDTSQEYTFSQNLSTEERAYIHSVAPKMGLKSKSYGKGASRRITVMKNELAALKKQFVSRLHILPSTLEKASQVLQEFPLMAAELEDVVPLTENKSAIAANGQGTHADCIHSYVPVVPPPLRPNALIEERKKLPTWSHRQEILDIICQNQVVMITGDTGSGKTTQVPQYLMELFAERKEPVRIICTQPRRIAAISVAERVANERAEPLGGTVGYQIRLESRMSPKTGLVFCTTGILLRTLMYHDSNLEKVTHLLIDEVHERDRYCDFLLGVLKSRLHRFPKLRVVLMSAALDINVFSNYFANCPVLHVQGKCYPVRQYFLEDALEMTDYLGHGVEFGVWDQDRIQQSTNGQQQQQHSIPVIVLDNWIQEAFVLDKTEALANLAKAVKLQGMPVNYQHSQTQLSALMVAAAKGRLDFVTEFLHLGADPAKKAGQWTAGALARSLNHHIIADLLDRHLAQKAASLLEIYKDRHDEEQVNVPLILDLLHLIEQQNEPGAVLIFLPGYEEIMNLREKILNGDPRFASTRKYEVFTLHSSMQSGDQRRVFLRPPAGKRKVVLSTNLAETSITIDDIVYVIDTGKVKVKSYDALTGVSSLKAEWVPQASAIQRKGRAGRCREGICFHLFSRERYETFEKYQIPEIFRVPLEELCLQSKNLSPVDLTIAEFIGLVPEAPNTHVIQRAVKMLQWMDALDPWENVTDLGRLLLELPVEPRLGKMLLTATVLHCLDPVLTIVCCLSYRDPFVLPADPQEKKLAAARKLELAAGTLSDHMAMLRAFGLWQAARANGKEREFSYKNFISCATMEVIFQLRGQILDQLRKSGFIRSFQELNVNASSWVAIKACILSGLYPQVGRICRKSGKVVTRQEPSVRLHMTSALLGEAGNGSQKKAIAELPSDWMIYEEISRYGGLVASLRCVTLVTPVVLAVFGGHCRLAEDCIKDGPVVSGKADEDDNIDDDDDDDLWEDLSTSDESLDEDALRELSEGLEDIALAEKFCRSPLPSERNGSGATSKRKGQSKMAEFQLDEWIRLRMDKNAALQLFKLRQKWQALFARRMRDPISPEREGDKQLLDTLLGILAQEERASGLPPCPELPRAVDFRRSRNNAPYSAPSSRPVAEMHSPQQQQANHPLRIDESGNRAVRGKMDGHTWRKESRPGPSRGGGYAGNHHRAQEESFRYGQQQQPRSNWRDLGNLKYRTGQPEIDFGATHPSPAQPGRGQHPRDFGNRGAYNGAFPGSRPSGAGPDNARQQSRNGLAKRQHQNQRHPHFGQSAGHPSSAQVGDGGIRPARESGQHPRNSSSYPKERVGGGASDIPDASLDVSQKKKRIRSRKSAANGGDVKNG